MSQINPARAALFVIAASVVVLVGALVFQYGFGLYPCALCFAQRWPYYLAIGLAVLALNLSRDATAGRTIVALLIVITLVFLGGTVLATYHVGIEQQWWEGTKACGGGLRTSGLYRIPRFAHRRQYWHIRGDLAHCSLFTVAG